MVANNHLSVDCSLKAPRLLFGRYWFVKLLILPVLLLISAQSLAYEITVWLSEEEEKAISVNAEERRFGKGDIYPHPCGMVRVVDVKKLPPASSADFVEGTEKVLEFSEDGEILRQWAMPVDSYVMVIKGESILVRYQRDQSLWINVNGSLKVSTPINRKSESFQCPKAVSDIFGDSEFDGCFKYEDLRDKQPRYLAYESVCT